MSVFASIHDTTAHCLYDAMLFDLETLPYPITAFGDDSIEEEPHTLTAYGLSDYENVFPSGTTRLVGHRLKKPKRRALIKAQAWPDACNAQELAAFANRLARASTPYSRPSLSGKAQTGAAEHRIPLTALTSNNNASTASITTNASKTEISVSLKTTVVRTKTRAPRSSKISPSTACSEAAGLVKVDMHSAHGRPPRPFRRTRSVRQI